MKHAFGVLLIFISLPVAAQNWAAVGQGMNNDVRCFFNDTVANRLYVGGNFQADGLTVLNGIGVLNNQDWDSLQSGGEGCFNFCNPVLSMCRFNGELYVGGMFTGVDGVALTSGIAKWNGSVWSSVGGAGQFGIVTALTVYNNELYAVGGFDSIGGISAYSIAKYNGSAWSAVADTIFQGEILACAQVFQGNLFVGSTMHVPALNIHCIAKYDGSVWSSPSNSPFVNGAFGITAMETYHNKLYFAGYFSSATGAPGDGIATWDGSNWSGVGGGLIDSLNYPAVISDLCIHQDKLVVVGAFRFAGGVSACNVATWNDTLWCSLGFYSNSSLNAAESFNDTLYIGGGFTVIDGDSFARVAKWIGGSYVDTCGVISTGVNEDLTETTIQVFPNPASGAVTFQFNTFQESRSVFIYDQLGREIWRKESSESSVQFPAEQFLNGLYFYFVEENSEVSSGKFVIAH